MKQRYFRLPWSRLRYSGRSLYRLALSDMQEASEALKDRRCTRQEAKVRLRMVSRLSLSHLGGH